MEHPCTYCKQTDNKYCYPTEDTFGDSYDIHQCNQCEAFFLTPLPTDKQLARAYDDSYYGEGEEKFEGLIEKILDYFRKKRASMIARFLKGKGRVLDIGCGNGRFLSFMKQYGNFELNGIEMEGGSAERARRIEGLKLNIGTLERGDYEAESIDAITLFHVFEHLTEINID